MRTFYVISSIFSTWRGLTDYWERIESDLKRGRRTFSTISSIFSMWRGLTDYRERSEGFSNVGRVKKTKGEIKRGWENIFEHEKAATPLREFPEQPHRWRKERKVRTRERKERQSHHWQNFQLSRTIEWEESSNSAAPLKPRQAPTSHWDQSMDSRLKLHPHFLSTRMVPYLHRVI